MSNNTITLSWKARKQSCVEGYIVEVDDGGGGKFVEVYSGKSHECSVAGLQFDSTYRARVRSYNKAGQGEPSDEVYLTTSESIKFKFYLKRLTFICVRCVNCYFFGICYSDRDVLY